MKIHIKDTTQQEFKLFDIIKTDEDALFLLIPIEKKYGALNLDVFPCLWTGKHGGQLFDSVDELIQDLQGGYMTLELYTGTIELSN